MAHPLVMRFVHWMWGNTIPTQALWSTLRGGWGSPIVVTSIVAPGELHDNPQRTDLNLACQHI